MPADRLADCAPTPHVLFSFFCHYFYLRFRGHSVSSQFHSMWSIRNECAGRNECGEWMVARIHVGRNQCCTQSPVNVSWCLSNSKEDSPWCALRLHRSTTQHQHSIPTNTKRTNIFRFLCTFLWCDTNFHCCAIITGTTDVCNNTKRQNGINKCCHTVLPSSVLTIQPNDYKFQLKS